MDSRFAHLYKRDSSVSMIRVKMSRRRSQTQKENRKRMQNMRRHLDQLPELELSMDVSSLEKSVMHAQGTGRKTKVDKSSSAVEERKKMLERFKENKALQKEKEKREKEKKGLFKVGLYRPQPLGYLPSNPVVPSTTKAMESVQSTRVTRSMKQQQQAKLPTERQAAPKKAELAPRANKPSAPANVRGRAIAVEPVVRAPTTRSSAKTTSAAVPAKTLAKPASDLKNLRTRSANKQPTVPSAGRGKRTQGQTESMPAVENKTASEDVPTLNISPVRENMEEAKVTPSSFAPQGFVFQPPSGLKTFQPTPLSPRSADAFLSPSLCLDTRTESTVPSPPTSDSFAAAPAPVSPSSLPAPATPLPAPATPLPAPATPLPAPATPLPAPATLPPAPATPPPALATPPPALATPPPALASPSPPSVPVEPQHDVPYFRAVMANETERLTGLSELWESRFNDYSIPEDMRDRMRTAVGQARLLMKERFGQFSGLVDDCDLGRGEKVTTCSDLQGFWDMVFFQVEDVNKKFNALKEAEARGWQEETKPVIKQKKVVKKPSVVGGKTGAGVGASAAAKSRLAAVKAAMKAKQVAEKTASASDDSTPASNAPANPLAAQTVVFQGGFFQVESPIKVVGAPRVRTSAVPLLQFLPCVSKFNTPSRPNRPAVSCSSPNPCATASSTEVAPSTVPFTEDSQPTANLACSPEHPAQPLLCSPQPLQASSEHHIPSIRSSPAQVSHTQATELDHDTSDDIGHTKSDLVNALVQSLMESSEIKPRDSFCQLEAELPVGIPEQSDVRTEPAGCIQDTALFEETTEEPMVSKLEGSPSVSPSCASPIKAHTLSFTLCPSPFNITSPQAETVQACVSEHSSPFMMSITPPHVVSPVPSDCAIIPVNESASVEMTENPDTQNIADTDFERYLQPTVCCSLSPARSMATERFSLGAVDVEMESPQNQTEEPSQDIMVTPTALPRMAPLVFTPWTEQLMDNPLPFTPEQRDRVRQSLCVHDLMMFTPPSSK